MIKNVRFVSVLALAALAAASQATVFSFIGQTLSGITSSTTSFTTTSVLNGSQTPYNAITSGLVTIGGGGTMNTVVFSAPAGTLTVRFDGVATTSNSPGTSSITSMGTITGSTGTFAGTQGNLTITSNSNFTGGFNLFTATGNVTPEPSALAALGLGAVALVRRRRKA